MTRYNESPETAVELLIDASPQTVWDIVTDPQLPARFSAELVEANWDTHEGDEPGLGSTIAGHSHREGRDDWNTISFVTVWEPRKCFAWAVREVENSGSRWRFELESVEGKTLLRQHYRIGPGPSGVSKLIDADPDNEEKIIEDRLVFQAENMMRTLNGVKTQAESQ